MESKLRILLAVFSMFAAACAGTDDAKQQLLSSKGYADDNGRLGLRPSELLTLSVEDGRLRTRSQEFRSLKLDWSSIDGSLVGTFLEDGGLRIARIEIDSGKVIFLASGAGPRYSRDGSLIAFQRPNGKIGIAQLKEDGLEPIVNLVTRPDNAGKIRSDVTSAAERYAWATDQMRLAYLRDIELKQQELNSPLDVISVKTEIRVYDVKSGIDRQVYVSPDLGDDPFSNPAIGGVSFGPNGRVYFSQGLGSWSSGTHASLAFVDEESLASGALLENLANYPGTIKPIVSPDGRRISFGYSPEAEFMSFPIRHEKALMDLESGSRRNFTEAPRSARGSHMRWSADGMRFAYVCNPGALAGTLCIASGKGWWVTQLELESMAEVGDFAFSRDGTRLAWVSRDLTDTIRIKVARADGSRPKTIYELPLTDVRDIALGRVQKFRWNNVAGLEFEGLLFLPVAYRRGERVPLVVSVHGGPGGGISLDGEILNSTPLEYHMWSAKGYAVFVADYRKGQIASRDLNLLTRQEDEAALYQSDAQDVLAGIDYLIDLGIADPRRLAIIGHSAGSNLVNQLLTNSDRFAAAISKEGVHDMRENSLGMRVAEMSSVIVDDLSFLLDATPDNLDQLLAQSSPIVYADKIKTPLIYIKVGAGADKYVETRRKQANAFVDAINDAGGIAETLFFPDDFHVIMKEENVRALLRTSIDWIDFWLKGVEDSNPDKAPQYARWYKLREQHMENLEAAGKNYTLPLPEQTSSGQTRPTLH